MFAVRLSLARRLRGRSRRDLAEALGVAESTFTYWEQGRSEPSSEVISRLARLLSVPVTFFSGQSQHTVPSDTVSFRSLRTLTRRDRDRACAVAEVAAEIGSWMDSRYKLPSVRIPDLSDASPEIAAAEMRRYLMVGQTPLPSMTSILEHIGVRCFSLGSDISKADALSTWVDDVPLVLFNVGKSAERSRNDGAHELGHLVLHRHRAPSGDRAEQEAVAFASEFLVPREALMRDAPSTITLAVLLSLKAYWGVSAAFMLKRLTTLDRLSTWTARSLWQQLSARGFRSGEPDGMPREVSQVLTQVVNHQHSISRRPFTAIASDLALSVVDVRTRFEGLLAFELHDGNSDAPDAPNGRNKPPLRLIS